MKFSLFLFLFCFSSICYSQVKVSSDPKSGALIVRAPKEQQDQIKKMILSLDDPYEHNIVKVIPIKYLYADELSVILSNVMSVLKPSQLSRNSNFNPVTNGMVLADGRTNQIILISDSYTNNKIECIIKQLDKKIKLEDNAFYLSLKNAKSSDISNIINEISRK